jgi:hypothetical protein
MRTHPSKKYKANENTSKHNTKKKQKQTINKKSGEDDRESKVA